jgi:hypothetical protein
MGMDTAESVLRGLPVCFGLSVCGGVDLIAVSINRPNVWMNGCGFPCPVSELSSTTHCWLCYRSTETEFWCGSVLA